MTFYSSLAKHVACYIYRPTCNVFENCCDPSLYYSQLGKVLMETDLVVYVLLCSYIIYSLGLVLTAVCKPGGVQVKWTVSLSLCTLLIVMHTFAAATVSIDYSKFTTSAAATSFIDLSSSSALLLCPSILQPCPSVLSSPLSCQSTALSVVSALLIISLVLVGHLITVIVCVLVRMLRKKRHSFCTERYM